MHLHTQLAAVALQRSGTRGSVVGGAPNLVFPTESHVLLSEAREAFLSTCEKELFYRKKERDFLSLHGLLSGRLRDAQDRDAEALLQRLRVATADIVQPQAGAGAVGLDVKLTLGDARLPASSVAAEMGALFRVPVLQGWLPEPGSAAGEALKLCPAATNEDLDALDAGGLPNIPSLSPGQRAALKAHAATPGGPYGCTPAGLRAVAAALGPGGIGVLYGPGHFSTVFCWPEPHPQSGLHDVFLLNYENLHMLGWGALWSRLGLTEAPGGGSAAPVALSFCRGDFQQWTGDSPVEASAGLSLEDSVALLRQLSDAQLRGTFAQLPREAIGPVLLKLPPDLQGRVICAIFGPPHTVVRPASTPPSRDGTPVADGSGGGAAAAAAAAPAGEGAAEPAPAAGHAALPSGGAAALPPPPPRGEEERKEGSN